MAESFLDKRTDARARKIRQTRDGEFPHLVFCEGIKVVEEALKSGWTIQSLYCLPKTKSETCETLARFKKTAVPLTILNESVMDFISDLTTPPGVIAIAEKKISRIPASTFLMILHGIQLPQNAGSLFRTAEAAGVEGVYLTAGTADPFGPKAIRGSAGSVFRIPSERTPNLNDVVRASKSNGRRVVAAVQDGSVDYDRFDWKKPLVLAVGSEGKGFTKSEIALFDETVKIPMKGNVESLNAATAAAVCLFEAARQRRN